MRVLALDIASTTGFCVGEPGRLPRFGSFSLPTGGGAAEIGRKAAAFENWLCDLLTVEQPSLLAFEAPLPSFGGNLKTSQDTIRLLYGLPFLAEKVAYLRDIDCEEANLQRVRKFFCGNGHAKKAEIIARCVNAYGWKVANDHEADAGAVWAYVMEGLKQTGRVA